jgi:hypothetical protein
MTTPLPQDILDKLFLLSDIDMIQQTREFQSDFVKNNTKYLTFNEAVKAENLTNLMWLHRNGRSGDSNTFLVAAETGNLDLLDWLKDVKCQWNKRVFNKVMKGSNEDVIEWFKKHGETGNEEPVETEGSKRETRHSKKMMKQQAVGGTTKKQWYVSAYDIAKTKAATEGTVEPATATSEPVVPVTPSVTVSDPLTDSAVDLISF